MNRDANGGIPDTSIILQRVSDDRRFTPQAYAETYLGGLPTLGDARSSIKAILAGGRRGVEFSVSSIKVVDTLESFSTGRSNLQPTAARHVIFEAERRLYECVCEGSPGAVESFRPVLLTFCASVTET